MTPDGRMVPSPTASPVDQMEPSPSSTASPVHLRKSVSSASQPSATSESSRVSNSSAFSITEMRKAYLDVLHQAVVVLNGIGPDDVPFRHHHYILIILFPALLSFSFVIFRWGDVKISGGLPAALTLVLASVLCCSIWVVHFVFMGEVKVLHKIVTRKYLFVAVASLATSIGRTLHFVALTKIEATAVFVFMLVSTILAMTPVNALVLRRIPDPMDALALSLLLGGSFCYAWHSYGHVGEFNLSGVLMAVGGAIISCTGDVLLEWGGRYIEEEDCPTLKTKLIVVAYELYKTFWCLIIGCVINLDFFSSSKWLPFSLIPATILAIFTVIANVTLVTFGALVTNELLSLVLPFSYVFEVIWLLTRKVTLLEVLHVLMVLVGALLNITFLGDLRYRVAYEQQSVLRRIEMEFDRHGHKEWSPSL